MRVQWIVLLTVMATGLSLRAPGQIAPSPPALLQSGFITDTGDDERPQLVTDGAGNWVSVWDSNDTLGGVVGADLDIFVSRSTDNGVTWTARARLNSNGASDSGHDWRPALATNGTGAWVAVWYSNENLGGTAGTDYDIFVSRSSNNGETWTSPALLNTNGTTDSGDDEIPRIVTDGVGSWVAVWDSNEDLGGATGPDYDVIVARSTDNGVTWTAPALLNSNGTIDSADDIRVELVADGAGIWVVAWASNADLGGTAGWDYDILFSRSTDNGVTWSPVALLDSNGAADMGEDFRPSLATDRSGNWVAAWHSNNTQSGTAGPDLDLFVSRSTDDGLTWTASITLNTNGATDSGEDEFVRVTTDGMGNWVALWESNENLGGTAPADYDIFVSRSINDGLTWSPPALFNIDGTTENGSEFVPQLATDGAGNWVSLWESNGNLDGDSSPDYDIAVSRFFLDSVLPTVTMTSAAPDPTGTSPIVVTATFSAAVTGFTSADVLAGNATVGNFSGSGSNYTFSLTPTASGTVTADIAASACVDAVGNGNVAATQFARVFALPPIINAISDTSVNDGASYSVTPSLAQGAGPVTWSLTSPATPPTNMAIDAATGRVTWPASYGFSPVSVTISATGPGGTDTESWVIAVNPIIPIVNAINDTIVTDTVTYSVTPTLEQGSGAMTWSLTAPAAPPTNMAINAATGRVTWTGDYAFHPVNVTIQVTGPGGTDTESWVIAVNPIIPIIDAINDTFVINGDLYSLTPTLAQGSGTMTWSLPAPASRPTNMAINSTTGRVTWTADFAFGPVNMTLGVSGPGGTDTESWVINVSPPPIWVDFGHTGTQLGTFSAPFRALGTALNAASSGDIINMKGNTGTPYTPETPVINKPLRLQAVGGSVRIGGAPTP